jgi:hypothetical protein
MSIADKNMADEDFWCNLAAESIYSSADRRSKSVEALKGVITWAFGLFTTGGFFLGLFGKINDTNPVALVSLGIGFSLLTIAYSQAYKAQYPVPETFRPLVPEDVLNAFKSAVVAQSKLFKQAVTITSAGITFIAIGILIAFGTIKPSTPPKMTAPPSGLVIRTGVEKKGGLVYVPVIMMGKPNDLVDLSLINTTPISGAKDSAKTGRLLSGLPMYADTAGRLYYSFSFKPADTIKTLLLIVDRRESKIKDTLLRQVAAINLNVDK